MLAACLPACRSPSHLPSPRPCSIIAQGHHPSIFRLHPPTRTSYLGPGSPNPSNPLLALTTVPIPHHTNNSRDSHSSSLSIHSFPVHDAHSRSSNHLASNQGKFWFKPQVKWRLSVFDLDVRSGRLKEARPCRS